MLEKIKLFAATLQMGGDVNIPNTLSSDEILQNALNIAYFVAGIIAVITIIVGGIMYATSQGEAGNVTKAKNLILYAVIGLVVVLAAWTITSFVLGSF